MVPFSVIRANFVHSLDHDVVAAILIVIAIASHAEEVVEVCSRARMLLLMIAHLVLVGVDSNGWLLHFQPLAPKSVLLCLRALLFSLRDVMHDLLTAHTHIMALIVVVIRANIVVGRRYWHFL